MCFTSFTLHFVVAAVFIVAAVVAAGIFCFAQNEMMTQQNQLKTNKRRCLLCEISSSPDNLFVHNENLYTYLWNDFWYRYFHKYL